MKTVQVKTEKRDVKAKTAKALRREGLIPATIYGPDTESHSVQLDARAFKRIHPSEYTHIFELSGDAGEPYTALVKRVHKKPVTDEILNVEFYKLMKGHKVTIKVALDFVNASEAVKMGAELMIIHSEAHIKCLPRQIPDDLKVDLSLLKEEGDTFTFGQIEMPEGVELLDPPKENVCKAEAPKIAIIEDDSPATAEGAEGEAAEGEAKAEGGEEAKSEEKKD